MNESCATHQSADFISLTNPVDLTAKIYTSLFAILRFFSVSTPPPHTPRYTHTTHMDISKIL